VFDRCIVTETQGLVFKKDEETRFGFTFTVLATADGAAGWRRYESTTVVS
jgi:hypothetical protein